ncbi:MAG: COX15/CtaA family protein [Thermoflavifilum sp.]|nr:COX15/CtaA family protein [Thermoflavifilum sp.]MCL6514347.1 COX15/CtaA family protein [Alicyclobacillus sp.]
MSTALPLVTTVIIGVQMVLGGIVVGKDAGFVCPDWPLCDGQILPALSGPVLLELTHRFSALLVTVLVLWNGLRIWIRYRDHRLLRWSAVGSVISLFLQVVIGGLIVLFKLPGATTTIDVANSMVLLGLYVVITQAVWRDGRRMAGRPVPADPQLYALAPAAWTVFGTAAFAVVMGALFRHTGASEALYGRIDYLASHGQLVPPPAWFNEALLFIHILSGVMVACAAVWFLVAAVRQRRMVGLAVWLLACVVVQMALGITSLGTELALIPSTIHWGVAGLLMATVTHIAATVRWAKQAEQAAETRNEVVFA